MKKNKVIKHIVNWNHRHYAFDTVDQAAKAVAFFSKLKLVEFQRNDNQTGWHYRPADEDSLRQVGRLEMEANQEYRERPELIGLPAPKRGHVDCAVCVSVSVKPGQPCGSCGTVAPK